MRHMVGWLPRVGSGHEYELIADEDDLDFLAPGPGVSVLPVARKLRGPLRNILWHQTALPGIVKSRGYDVLFLMAANRRIPYTVPCPTVGTVHDLASFHVAAKYDPFRDVYVRWVLPRLIRTLSHVVTVSRASKEDILKFCQIPSERVTVVHNGVDRERFGPGDGARARASLAPLGVNSPYFLYVSRIEHPGKNHVGLIDAFAACKRRGFPFQLVLAGPDKERAAEVHRHAEASGFASDIHFLGFVSDETLRSLYHGAEALVFPSRYEGFGLPIIEAMACGVPVLSSNASALPEVGGDAAVYFDPLSTDSMVEAMMRVGGDEALRQDLKRRAIRRAAEFSVEAAARRTVDVIEQAGRVEPSSARIRTVRGP